MVKVFEDHLNEPRPRDRALALVALCVGGMVLARNVGDPALANDFRSHRARRGAEDRGLVSEIAYTQLVAVQTSAEVGAKHKRSGGHGPATRESPALSRRPPSLAHWQNGVARLIVGQTPAMGHLRRNSSRPCQKAGHNSHPGSSRPSRQFHRADVSPTIALGQPQPASKYLDAWARAIVEVRDLRPRGNAPKAAVDDNTSEGLRPAIRGEP
jgi:hypothetical protein